MRILLDECIDESLRYAFTAHECQTCRYAGFKGLTNGELIAAADQAGFQALITVDQNIAYQQSLANRAISIVVLQAPTTNIDDLLMLMPQVLAALEILKAGCIVRVVMP